MPLALTQVAQHLLLLLLLNLKVFVERLNVGHQALLRIRNVLCLALNSLLERLKDVCLHVVRVELRLVLLVVLELGAHVLGDLLLLKLHLVDDGVIILLLDRVLLLNLSHPGAERSQLLDAWSQLCLLLFDFLLNLLDQGSQLLQGLALVVVELLFELGGHIDLVLNRGIASDALLLFKLLQEFIDISGTPFEDIARPLENFDFGFEFLKGLLALFVLQVLLLKIGGVLAEIVALQILAALDLLVVLFLLGELLFEGHLLSLEALNLLHFLVFLLLRGLGLATIDGKFVVSLLWLDLALKSLALTLKAILVRGQTLKLSLGRLWLIQDHLNSLKTVFLVSELSSQVVI